MKKSEATLRRQRRTRILAAAGALFGAALIAGGSIFVLNMSSDAEGAVVPEDTAVVTSAGTVASTAPVKPSASLANPEMYEDTAGSSATSSAVSVQSEKETDPTTSATSTTTSATTEATTATTKPKGSGKLESIADVAAGKVISAEKIDKSDLGKYFTSRKIEVDDAVYNRINGQSYKKNDNISLSSLRYLKMLHVNFNGEYQVGEMIVNKKVAGDVLEIFKSLCESGYQIHSMRLIDDFWAGSGDKSDYASIDANNTSAFCYRKATGGGNLSKHALGLAIDINPQQNPYVTFKDGKAKYSHDNAAKYVENRSSDTPHVITKKDKAYKLFRSYGWTWGGSWSSPKDYQHFQLN